MSLNTDFPKLIRWLVNSALVYGQIIKNPFKFVESDTWEHLELKPKLERSLNVFLFSTLLSVLIVVSGFVIARISFSLHSIIVLALLMGLIEFFARGFVVFLAYRTISRRANWSLILSIYLLSSVAEPISFLISSPSRYLYAQLAQRSKDPMIALGWARPRPEDLISHLRDTPSYMVTLDSVSHFLDNLFPFLVGWVLAIIYAKKINLTLFPSFLAMAVCQIVITLLALNIFLPIVKNIYEIILAK